ncbi:MAG TPA: MFS transporter [Gaiellaceae bacterium]|nr:MFS transporter [Gaiellaceae bacterium]
MSPQSFRRQFGLLRRNRGFRALGLATFASGLGTWIAVIALSVDVYDRTESATWVSALLVADFLPSVAIGLLMGPLIDRLSRRRIMIAADLVRLAIFVALPFTDSAEAIVLLAAAAGFATGFFRPASYAGLPNLVSSEELPGANSLVRAGEYLSWTIGTALGGVIVAASGPDIAYWTNAATFLASALLIFRISADRLQAGRAESRGYWRDIGDGFSIVFNSRILLAVFCAWNLVMLGNAGINVAEIVLAKVDFASGHVSGDVAFGLLWASSGLGLLLGSLYAPRWLEVRGIVLVYTASLALMGFGALATAISPTVWVALPCMVLGGAGNGAAVVYNSLLVQRGAPDEYRGRAFTVIMSTNFALLGVGMVVAGPLTDALGARPVFAISAACAGLGALVGFVFLRSARAESTAAPASVPS